MAKKTVSHLDKFTRKLKLCRNAESNPDMDQMVYDLKQRFVEAMDDDLNVAKALAAVFEFARQINPIMDKKGLSPADRQKVEDVLKNVDSVLGIMDLEPAIEKDQTVDALIRKREEARRAKNWTEADHIRRQLADMGIEVIDTLDVDRTIWRKEREP